MNRRPWRARARHLVVLMCGAVAVVLATALPAAAHRPVLSGHTVCANGQHVVMWTIGNSEPDAAMTITSASTSRAGVTYAVTGYTVVVAGGAATSAQSVLPGHLTGATRITVVASWPNGQIGSRELSVSLGSVCPTGTTTTTTSTSTSTTAQPATTTTTTQPSTTTTAAVTTTTNAPTTSTTEPATTTTTTTEPATTTTTEPATTTTTEPATTTTTEPATTTTTTTGPVTTTTGATTETTVAVTGTTVAGISTSTTMGSSGGATTSTTEEPTTDQTAQSLGTPDSADPEGSATAIPGTLPRTGGSGAEAIVGIFAIALGSLALSFATARHGRHVGRHHH